MRERLNLLLPLAFAIQKQFDFFKIGLNPHVNRFALTLLPVPVRKEVEHGLGTPPRFVIVEIVLREAEHIDNAELRVDGRPAVRSRFAAVVEAGPRESARSE